MRSSLGAAERILKMAEAQSTHRMTLEKSVVDSDNRRSERGQLCAFTIAVLAFGIAGWLGSQGKELAAGIIGGGDLIALVSVFIYGRRQKGKERAEARQQSPST
ncbi:MAG: hypothetical protein UY77_C0014G0004 [Candidatus Uhrbacteria bacterium GW2011_GWA2_53_10]|uniref:DUF2335 domain-containing protein n=1 Tax=Candidatus Uhrbacteria bacterium GW2011_GWA2_53_10 TaxID=1618980 RepID=A0A0G2AJJ8_9BACT|nr:MAG: hypothetical protein UY77_C0014G0004 [Candidatus Uhrbacteria bacterium GW2011_GWA2_53_10]